MSASSKESPTYGGRMLECGCDTVISYSECLGGVLETNSDHTTSYSRVCNAARLFLRLLTELDCTKADCMKMMNAKSTDVSGKIGGNE
jgi:hypothetical protein